MVLANHSISFQNQKLGAPFSIANEILLILCLSPQSGLHHWKHRKAESRVSPYPFQFSFLN